MTAPAYGKWTEAQLRELVRNEVNRVRPESAMGQARLAMDISKYTGSSYPWLRDEVERQCPPARIA